MKLTTIILALVMLLLHSAAALAGPLGADDESFDRIALFRAVGAMYGLDPALLGAIATAESDNNDRAVSNKGAIGLMQLMPATASRFSVANPFDPVDNALGAARFLDYLRSRQACRNITDLIAAYNAGAGAVEHYQGIPPFPETREYVRRVLWLYLLDGTPPIRNGTNRAVTGRLSAKSIAGTHKQVNGDQAVLDQLAELKRERASAARVH